MLPHFKVDAMQRARMGHQEYKDELYAGFPRSLAALFVDDAAGAMFTGSSRID